jgi:protein-S-isoprenylcysteine O-methyltransferase Ste14
MKHRVFQFLGNTLLICFFLLFFYLNIESFFETKKVTLLLFAASAAITVFLFIIRKAPARVTTDPFDYLLAVTGTLAPLLFRPSSGGVEGVSVLLVSVGIIIQLLALISLNTSFGIVAADRGIKTSGLYRFVRHPMYASYLFMYGGYVLANPSILNGVILVAAFGVQVWRIVAEEKILSLNPLYLEYKKVVVWRVIPHIF